MRLLIALSFLLAACASSQSSPRGRTDQRDAAPAPTAPATAADAEPESAPAESGPCREGRLRILAEMEVSRGRPCTADDECRAVESPGTPEPSHAQVVHASDATALAERARAHLEACGAFVHHDPAAGYVEVEARCQDGRCAALETHVAPLELE